MQGAKRGLADRNLSAVKVWIPKELRLPGSAHWYFRSIGSYFFAWQNLFRG